MGTTCCREKAEWIGAKPKHPEGQNRVETGLMTHLAHMTAAQLEPLLAELMSQHAALKDRGLSIDISRGKPSKEQLDLSQDMLGLPRHGETLTQDGLDARNYGGDALGLPELRRIFAPLLGVPVDQVAAGGNSSLAMMHDCLVWALLRGVPGGVGAWVKEPRLRFLCPVPGYELHHRMSAAYGIELLPVPVREDGPDMETVSNAVQDPSVKGMWCVPTHANPTGETYSDAVVNHVTTMKTAAADFRLFWDEAYLVHHFRDGEVPASSPLRAAANAGNADRALVFASTSKITFAGSGVGFLASSLANIEWYKTCRLARGPGEDKLNQLRHARFLKNTDNLRELMGLHAQQLIPKFDAVLDAFNRTLADVSSAVWSKPKGGYFINVEAYPGTARRAIELAGLAGIKLTQAGSTWPDGGDPHDSNMRIAPSHAALSDIETAADIIALSILLSEVEARVATNTSPALQEVD